MPILISQYLYANTLYVFSNVNKTVFYIQNRPLLFTQLNTYLEKVTEYNMYLGSPTL